MRHPQCVCVMWVTQEMVHFVALAPLASTSPPQVQALALRAVQTPSHLWDRIIVIAI